MLLLLSPAKSLDYDTPVPARLPHTLPAFTDQSAALIELLRGHSPQTLAALMKISDPLAALNVARYAAWSPEANADNARQAILAFNGGVYAGLDARTLTNADLQWAQQHLAILSGLYGVLRPLDRMQPHRLEMGTRLATPAGQNLYQFWGARIAERLNVALDALPRTTGVAPVVLNLASQEYFRAVDRKARGRLRVRRLESRRLQGHRHPCQARTRADGAPLHSAACDRSGCPHIFQYRGLCLRQCCQQRRPHGFPAPQSLTAAPK